MAMLIQILALLVVTSDGPCQVSHIDGPTTVVSCTSDDYDEWITVATTAIPRGARPGCTVDFRRGVVVSCAGAETYDAPESTHTDCPAGGAAYRDVR